MFHSHAQCAAECLENRLDLMMRVAPANIVDVQGNEGVIDETLEKLAKQVDVESANDGAREVGVVFQPRPPGKIDHHPRQRLIQRNVGMAVAADAGLVERLVERLPESDAEIFHGMVGVYFKIAFGLDVEVDHAVTGDLIEHVFEKRQAGFRRQTTAAVEVDRNRNAGFPGVALNAGAARLFVHVCLAGGAGAVVIKASHYTAAAAQAQRKPRHSATLLAFRGSRRSRRMGKDAATGASRRIMNRKPTILLGIGLAIVAGVVAALLWITRPGQFRPILRDHVAAATGYELLIAGGISLDLLPTARLTLEDARLRNPGLPQELAAAARVQMDIDRDRALRGELAIESVRIEDFHVNWFLDAAGESNWDIDLAAGATEGGLASALETLALARFSADNGRLDIQNLRGGRRFLLKNLRVIGENFNLQGDGFPGQASFALEWFDRGNGRLRESEFGLLGEIEADAAARRYALTELDLNSSPVLLQGDVELGDFPGNADFRVNLTSNEFNAKLLLRNLGLLPEPAEAELGAPGGSDDETWPSLLAINASGNAEGLSASATVDSSARRVIEASTEIRFGNNVAPANVRYQLDIGELDLGALFDGAGDEGATAGSGAALARTPRPPRPPRPLPDLQNLILSGAITADALRAGALGVENLTLYTNVEDRVFDAEITPLAAMGGTLSASLRWNAANGELAGQTRGENLAVSELLPLITRLDVLSGRLHADSAFTAQNQSLNGLLNDLSGDASFMVTENLVNIGLIKQIFTAISALSPSGEAIQQWPDLIRFAEVAGDISLEGGLGNEHSFNLRMDNLSARGTGVADLAREQFAYELLLTMLGEDFPQTIPVGAHYQGVSWPVECAGRFSDELLQFCRPDFNAVREIFSRIGGAGQAN